MPGLITMGTAQETAETDYADTARSRIDQGLDWLKTRQTADGSWVYNPGVTAMGVMAFLNAGYDTDDPVVTNAVDYIISTRSPDGSFTSGTNVVYETSLCIVALTATRNPDYKDEVEDAVRYLESVQKTEENSDEVWWEGGIGYGGDGRPDLSNNQFAVMALHSASTVFNIDIKDSTWEGVELFATRSQNLKSTNSDWAQYDDGGFMYFPGYSHAGDETSYGSMTAAGIWCYILSGVDRSDDRVTSAVAWMNDHHTFTENPGIGQTGLYYYYWTYARAMTLYGKPLGNWYNSLTSRLAEIQNEEGFWVNSEADYWWENVPEVATLYALNALSAPIVPWDDGITIEIELHSDKYLHVFDNEGRHTGEGVEVRSGNEDAIPGSTVISGDEYTKVTIANTENNAYTIGLSDNGDDWYELKVTVKKDGNVLDEKEYEGEVQGDLGSKLIINSIAAPGSIYLEEPSGGSYPAATYEYTVEEGTSYTPIIIIGVVVLIILIIISIALIRRKK